MFAAGLNSEKHLINENRTLSLLAYGFFNTLFALYNLIDAKFRHSCTYMGISNTEGNFDGNGFPGKKLLPSSFRFIDHLLMQLDLADCDLHTPVVPHPPAKYVKPRRMRMMCILEIQFKDRWTSLILTSIFWPETSAHLESLIIQTTQPVA